MTTRKTIALTIQTFAGKLMFLLFNMLSRFVITFLPRNKCLLISWLQSPSAVILEPKKKSLSLFHRFPIYLPWSDGMACHDISFFFLMLSQFFHSLFSPSSRGSLLSAIRVVSSAYLRLLIFLPAILIPACASSILAFCKMYSAHKLNKQGDSIQPWHIPFLIWN